MNGLGPLFSGRNRLRIRAWVTCLVDKAVSRPGAAVKCSTTTWTPNRTRMKWS